jgi:putative transposase
MSRPLRIEYAGALYHVTSRGDRQATLFRDDSDRSVWLSVLDQVCQRYNFVVHGFCQMTNHYHLVLATAEGNLAQGMRLLNGAYSQYFNRRHDLVGHVFQGRYKAILVQRETYLLELTRYVVLNPLRAGMVSTLEDWRWSSHHYVMSTTPPPRWLEVRAILDQFHADPAVAVGLYQRFVQAGRSMDSPLKKTQHQLILGDETFTAGALRGSAPQALSAVPREQRRAARLSLQQYQARYPNRAEAMAHAYRSTAYTMQQIGEHFGVSAKTVSRAVKSIEKAETVSECRH